MNLIEHRQEILTYGDCDESTQIIKIHIARLIILLIKQTKIIFSSRLRCLVNIHLSLPLRQSRGSVWLSKISAGGLIASGSERENLISAEIVPFNHGQIPLIST